MALTKRLFEELNSSIPFNDKCTFLLEVYSDVEVCIPNKERIIFGWLAEFLSENQGLVKKSKKNSIKSDKQKQSCILSLGWKTLLTLLEKEHKPFAVHPLKKSFVKVFPNHLHQAFQLKDDDLWKSVLECLIHMLETPNREIRELFNCQVSVLFEILNELLAANSFWGLHGTDNAIERVSEYLLQNHHTSFNAHLDNFLAQSLKAMIVYRQHGKKYTQSNLLLKEICCPKENIQQIEEIFTSMVALNDSPKAYFKTFHFLQETRQNSLKTEDSTMTTAIEDALAEIFEGLLSKMRKSKSKLFFEGLVVFCRILNVAKGFPQTDSAASIMGIEPILSVCEKNSYLFNFQGDVPRELQLDWFKVLMESLLKCRPAHTEKPEVLITWFSNLYMLIKIRPEIVESCILLVWKNTWLEFVSDEQVIFAEHTKFLVKVLETYAELRSLPKMISKYLLQAKDTPGRELKKLDNAALPENFKQKLAECFSSLPTGQAVSIWKTLLDTLKESETTKITVVGFSTTLEILTIFLLHNRLVDASIPISQITMVPDLMSELYEFLQVNLSHVKTKNTVRLNLLLNLLHAWGEVKLSFKIFQPQMELIGTNWKSINETPEALDLGILYSGNNWLTLLIGKTIASQKPVLLLPSILLLVQKIRTIIISDNFFNQFGQSAICSTVETLYETITSKSLEEDFQALNDDNIDTTHTLSLYTIAIETLPLVSKLLSQQRHAAIATMIVKILLTVGLKQPDLNSKLAILYTRTVSFLQSDHFTESTCFQSSLITVVLLTLDSLLTNRKRKHNDESSRPNVFEQLSKSQIWLNPNLDGIEVEQIYKKLETSISYMMMWINGSSENGFYEKKSKQKDLLLILEIFNYLPLQALKPTDQLRCIITILHLITRLSKTDTSRFNNVLAEICCKILVSLLETKCDKLFELCDSRVLLKICFNIVCSGDLDQQIDVSTGNLIDKIVYLLVSNDKFQEMKKFMRELTKLEALSLSNVHFLQVLLKVITTQKTSFSHSKRPEVVAYCEDIGLTVCTLLNKWLKTSKLKQDNELGLLSFLQMRTLKWLLEFYCSSKTELHDTEISVIIKEHEDVIEKTQHILKNETEVSEVCLQLIQTLCIFFKKIKPNLPKGFLINTWNAVTVNGCQELAPKDAPEKKLNQTMLELPQLSLNTLNLIIRAANSKSRTKILARLEKTAMLIDFNNSTAMKNLLALYSCLFQNIMKSEFVLAQHTFQFTLRMCLVWITQNMSAHHSINETLVYLRNMSTICPEIYKANSICQTFQICSMVNLNGAEPEMSAKLCQSLLNWLNYLLLRHSNFTLDSIASYTSIFSTVFMAIVHLGEQEAYANYSVDMLNCISASIQQIEKTIAQMEQNAKSFSKPMCYLVTDYSTQIQKITLHPTLKSSLLVSLNKILEIVTEHDVQILGATLDSGARQIFEVLHREYLQYYKYKRHV